MRPVLYGREGPLRVLGGALEAALAGHGRVAVVTGEAGIGKSAVAEALARQAEAQGAAVTRGRAWEFADAPPYFPLWPALRALGVPFGEPPAEARDDARAFELWERVLASLARASSRTPAVWVLEDLHAADLGTLDLLTFLAHPVRALRVLVVATARDTDDRLTDRMRQRLVRIGRDGLDVPLDPLGEADVAKLAADTLGRPLNREAVRPLTELTGGNPFFVEECARGFVDDGGGPRLRALPPTAHGMVLERLQALPEATRRGLDAGAVLGREFSAALVATMLQTPVARVRDALGPALRAGLVHESRAGHLQFAHTLVRDALEDALAEDERAELHGRADDALATLVETADVLVERARHALSALPSQAGSSAAALGARATELLEREGAWDRAFELHQRILDAGDAGLLPLASVERRLHVARIARAAGRSDAARCLAEGVVAAARASDAAPVLAEAALLLAADVRPGFVDRSMVARLTEARAALGDDATALGCRVLARLATALTPAPDPAVPVEMAHAAIRHARATGEDALLAEVLEITAWALDDYAPQDRAERAAELLESALRADDTPRAVVACGRLAMERLELGDFDRFERHTERMLALSDQLGHPRHRWRALLLASTGATLHGYFAESDRHAAEAADLAVLTDDPGIGVVLASHEVSRARAQRKSPAAIGRALDALDRELVGAWEGPLIGAVMRAGCAARLEDGPAAREALAKVGARAPVLDRFLDLLCPLAEAHALVGDEAERRRSRALLAAAGTDHASTGQFGFMYEGTVRRLVGLLNLSLGDLASAEAHLREAHALAVQRRHTPWVAQLAWELSKVAARVGRTDEARARAEESRTLARELGMVGLAGPPVPEPVVARLALTREGEVWRVERGPAVARVKDSRGMQLLARLVERPGDEVHVLALASDEGAGLQESSAGEMLDERARKAYRDRLSALAEALDEAEHRGDARRAATLGRERDALVAELSRASGLGGRSRQSASATERARSNVQRRLKEALGRIAEAEPALGAFLQRAVSTGTFCSYAPASGADPVTPRGPR